MLIVLLTLVLGLTCYGYYYVIRNNIEWWVALYDSDQACKSYNESVKKKEVCQKL